MIVARTVSWRLLQRIGAVLTLVLAALLLGADAGEYPAPSRAGLHALGRGVVPLLLVAVLNLAALDAGRRLQLLALVVNIALLGGMLTMVRSGTPPLVWMTLAVAALLVISSAMRAVFRSAITRASN